MSVHTHRKVEETKTAIIKAVTLFEIQMMDLLPYSNNIFVLSEFLEKELNCSYWSIIYHWNIVMDMPVKQYYGLYRDKRAIFWRSEGLDISEIAHKLGYDSYSEFLSQFKHRQGISFNSYVESITPAFTCTKKCFNHTKCCERHT